MANNLCAILHALLRFKSSYQCCFTVLESCKRNDQPVVCWGCENKIFFSSVNLEGRHGREEFFLLDLFLPFKQTLQCVYMHHSNEIAKITH